jgi:ATP-dependent Lon protease
MKNKTLQIKQKSHEIECEKGIVELKTILNEKVCYIQEIIRNTVLSINNYKKYDIFSNNDVQLCISILNELYDKSKTILEKNHSINKTTIDSSIENLQKIIDKLATVICGFGTKNIDDLIFVCFGTELKINCEDKIIQAKYDLIRKFFHPISYKIINLKNQKLKKKEFKSVIYCENKITEDTLQLEISNNLECFDIESNSFYYKIQGIQIVIQNEKTQKALIVKGILDDIILDFLSNEYIEYRKKSILDNIPNSTTFDYSIIKRIVESMTLKDIMIYGNNDIYKKQLAIQTDVNYIKYNKLDVTIKNFLEMESTMQRNMLINLLIYNKEDDIHYITYLLYDLITVHNNENEINEQQIYNSLPYKIKSYLKDTMKINVKYSQDMLTKYDISKISIEQQIYLLNVPENVKEKAMVKVKEIKNKSDESSMKAKQYLEGLLKIPFGIYKQEPILKLMKDINKKFILILNNFPEICKNIPIKEFYTKMEICILLDNIQKNIKKNICYDIQNKIKNGNIKEINLFISSLYNEFQNTNNIFTDIIKIKTKKEKKEKILEVLESNRIFEEITDDVLHKLYNIFENIQYSKSIQEIKDLQLSMKEINNSLNITTNVLDKSIYGHTYAKNQILKIIGQWMTGEQSGYCFGFEGSPGVGKTSLAKKGLSNCLKDENNNTRPFFFIALGGSSNGSTFEGHSYTYVNSTWGKIVDILMESKCMNPIIYIDELDKISKTEQGKEIIGILTHLIDTTQNDVFQDKYFNGINIDLSKTLFIFSYNDPEQIDKILLDRIHRIKFENLTLDDKLVIIEEHILPEINAKMGFSNTVILSNEVAKFIIENYTLEPGVRKLKEILFDLYGEINIEILKEENIIEIPIIITKENIEQKYLKNYQKIEEKKIHKTNKIGIINGLWANTLGKGGIIPIEATFFPSNTFLDLRLTGLQGDVMKESMNVSKSLAWNLTNDKTKEVLIQVFEKTKCQGLHIHCPEGSVSKDGPSAGAAITTVIYSLLNNIKIKNNIAITGEINLQGDITVIGGLEAKLFGGIKAGVKVFLYPESNKKDFMQFQEKYKNKEIITNIEFKSVTNIHEVFNYVFA